MLLAIIFLNVWGVFQLVVLGSFARTVRVRTVLAAVGVGLFFCAPVGALLEHAWTAAIAALTGRPVEAVISVAGYTTDPPFEETLRIVPLALLLIVPVIRRQLAVTDCVLIGAAAGAGFGLAEDLYRFGAAPQHATPVPGGWSVPFHSPVVESAGQRFFIPSMATALGGWLPDMGGFRLFGVSGFMLPNLLLIWSALAGLAVGLWLRLEGPARWVGPAALFAYASAAHAANNADVTFGGELLVTAPFRAVSVLQPLMPVAALAMAWWIDRRWHDDVVREHLLAAEQGASPRALGTWRAAVARMPESLFWIERFVRVRRACSTERRLGGAEAETLRLALTEVRNEIDRQLRTPGSWRSAIWAWTDDAWRVLRGPTTIVWIVLTLPATLWFVVGGWPATAGVQRLLSVGAGWAIVVVLTMAAQASVAWGLLRALCSWRSLFRIPLADPGAARLLGIVGATGAVGFGAFGAVRGSAPAPAGAAHIRDALESLTLSQLFPLADLAAALWNALFRPSPTDLRIPIPGRDGEYFTPTGVRRSQLNRAMDTLDHVNEGLDVLGIRRLFRNLGHPLATAPRLSVGSGDPNDVSDQVGAVFFWMATQILAEIFTTEGSGAPGRGWPPPAPGGGVNPHAPTLPGPPGPLTSPKATTLSPKATTLPPQGTGASLGSSATLPAPGFGTARTDPAPPALPGSLPPGGPDFD